MDAPEEDGTYIDLRFGTEIERRLLGESKGSGRRLLQQPCPQRRHSEMGGLCRYCLILDIMMPKPDGIQSIIGAGNVAMATGGAWNVGTCMNGVNFKYGVARLPYMKNEVTICTGGPQVVFSQSKHPDEAREFIKPWCLGWHLRRRKKS